MQTSSFLNLKIYDIPLWFASLLHDDTAMHTAHVNLNIILKKVHFLALSRSRSQCESLHNSSGNNREKFISTMMIIRKSKKIKLKKMKQKAQQNSILW